MNAFTIRPATLNDLTALHQFEQGVIDAERPFDPTLKSKDTQYYDLREMIAAPHVQLLVAEYGRQLIGSGYARIETSKPYNQHMQHAYLGFMYVLPEHRGKGVNKAIIAALETWASEQNVTEIRLEVYSENTAAVKAYEKVGFKNLLITMRKRINS